MKILYLFLLAACFGNSNAQEHQRYIEVNGTAELVLVADQINFDIQIKIVASSIEK